MKVILILISLLFHLQGDIVDTIYSTIVKKDNDSYEKTLEGYKNSEFWPMWSMPIGTPYASSSLIATGENTYSVKNIMDYDLNTAWIEGDSAYGIGEFFEFTFDFPENTEYAGAYQFYGICNLFNGYCKSKELWEANSRVKKLKVYYNNQFVCYVELCDTWQFQSFDIAKYFINRRDNKYMNAAYEIKNGDTLKFEIIELFKGSKYKDVAISEFLCEGAGN